MKATQITLTMFCLVTLLVGTHRASNAQEIKIVSPSAQANEDGNLSSGVPTNSLRIQYLYPASDFEAVPEGHRLIAFAQRADKDQPAPATVNFADTKISLSTTTANFLTATFADNVGADEMVVVDGPSSFSVVTSGPPGGPNPFGTPFMFDTPFVYDPTQGNLLVDISTSSGRAPGPGPSLDFQSTRRNTLLYVRNPDVPRGSWITNRLQVREFIFVPELPLVGLRAGDADQDLDFDQLDLVQVQIAAKYLTGQPATWGEGDWNAAPGGEPGNPPLGNGFFDQLDIVAALAAGTYLTGPYAAGAKSGATGASQTSVVYEEATGKLSIDTPASNELTSINITSTTGKFLGGKPGVFDGAFDNFAADNLFKATFGGSFGSINFGTILPSGIPEDDLASDLTVVGSLAGGGDLGDVDLVYIAVPEPSTLITTLIAVGLLGNIARGYGRSNCRR